MDRRYVSKEGVNVATRHFEQSRMAPSSESLLSQATLMSGYAAPLRLARIYNTAAFRQNLNWQEEAAADFEALRRGVRWAFAIEGGTALLICAVWYLWRLLM
jgi:hypothetical protein